MSRWLPALYDLDSQLNSWYAGISSSLPYSKRHLYEERRQSTPSLYLFIHTIHYQCRLVLNLSLVPQFSGLQLPRSSSQEIVGVAARVCIKCAQEVSQIAADLVTLDWDPSQLPAFFGYTMYTSATIQIAMARCADPVAQRQSRSSLKTKLRWLRSLRMFWSNLDKLVSQESWEGSCLAHFLTKAYNSGFESMSFTRLR